ncbi:MAG: PspC domain-containing protein [Bacteroidia bacterium]
MKKTTTIHLAGILFNIEEDAYEKLSQYLKSIEAYFAQNTGKNEIMEDIESRIAEILSEKLNANKQVIIMSDVDEVISIMGSAEHFNDSEQKQTNTNAYYTTTKRFYRNPDDKIIGGVCGGIAAYFDIDPLWIRLAWAVAFFIFGSGFLFYLLLWIIIPEAKTPSQKLEMRGEKINISNISKGISDDFKQFTQKTSREFSNVSANKFIAFFQNLFQYILDFIYGVGKWFLKTISIFLVLIFVFIILVLLSSLFSENYISINSRSYDFSSTLSDFFANPFEYTAFKLSILFLIGIPVIMLVSGLIKFIFNIKKSLKYLGIVALILWLAGWGLLIISVIPLTENFSEKTYSKSQITQYVLPNRTIFIKMKEIEEDNEDDGFQIKVFNKIFYSENNKEKNLGFPSVVIKKSKGDSLRINVINSAVAESKKQARQLAQNIKYDLDIKDSIIELSPQYIIPKEDKFHFQKTKVVIEIPQNRYVYFSKNMKYYLDDAENNIDADEYDMVGKKWLMGIDHLQCMEQCDDISNIKSHKKHKEWEEEEE